MDDYFKNILKQIKLEKCDSRIFILKIMKSY